MESVYSLLTVPNPLDPVNGRVQAATSFTLSGFKKRKRFEIVAASDGDSISLHGINPPEDIDSYGVPPGYYFLCPPTSVVTASPHPNRADDLIIRRTYAAAKDTGSSRQFLMFFHDTLSLDSTDPNRLSKRNTIVPTDSPIKAIEPVQLSKSLASTDPNFDILVFHQDGTINCFATQVQNIRWKTKAIPHSCLLLSVHVCSASLLTKFLLNQRDDILAKVIALAGRDQLHKLPLVCSLYTTQDRSSLRLSICAVHLRTKATDHDQQPILKLDDFEIPRVPATLHIDDSLTVSWHLPSGLIHFGSPTTIATYSVANMSPTPLSTIHKTSATFSHHMALNGSSLLALTGDRHLTMFDAQYSSVEDTKAFDPPLTPKKRKRDDIDSDHDTTPMSLLEFFPSLGLAVGLQGSELMAIQLTLEASSKRRKIHRSKLIDAIGRGAGSVCNTASPQDSVVDIFGTPTLPESESQWIATQSKLMSLARQGSAEEFDTYFARQLGLKSELVPGDGENTVRWIWGGHQQRARFGAAYRKHAILALRLMFTLHYADSHHTSESVPTLVIRFFAPNVFHWLVTSGNFNLALVIQAFRQYPEGEQVETIRDSELIASLVDFDPTLDTLCTTLTNHPQLDVGELVQGVKYIIRSFDQSVLPAPKVLLQAGDEYLPKSQAEPSLDEEVDSLLDNLEMALTTLQDDAANRPRALSDALVAINFFPTSLITDTLRSILSQHEIIFLIHLLRIELADGGWTSRYIDVSTTIDQSHNTSLPVIVQLLSCSVDAIGLTGWLSTTTKTAIDSVDELLESIRSEISAALEGAHDSSFLQGQLNEFLNYAHRVQVFDKPAYRPSVQPPEMPLAGKLPQIMTDRVNADGTVRALSKRNIGDQISRNKVQRYQYETIRLGGPNSGKPRIIR